MTLPEPFAPEHSGVDDDCCQALPAPPLPGGTARGPRAGEPPEEAGGARAAGRALGIASGCCRGPA
eukprot:scaffold336_cov250-Pinguiococcus_pyrenoidosus.AAC.7